MYKKVKKIYVIKNCKYYGKYFHFDTVCVVNNQSKFYIFMVNYEAFRYHNAHI